MLYGEAYGRARPETLADRAENRERLIGFAGADPHKGMDAVREFEHAIYIHGGETR